MVVQFSSNIEKCKVKVEDLFQIMTMFLLLTATLNNAQQKEMEAHLQAELEQVMLSVMATLLLKIVPLQIVQLLMAEL